MKNIILLIAVLVVSACATTSTVKSVSGTYELKIDGDTYRSVLLENGIVESYKNGKKREEEGKWKISKEGELHDIYNGDIFVFRINKDTSITLIAEINKDGKRVDLPKEKQITVKRIK